MLYAKNVTYDFYSIGFKTEKKGKEALQLWTTFMNILESTNHFKLSQTKETFLTKNQKSKITAYSMLLVYFTAKS